MHLSLSIQIAVFQLCIAVISKAVNVPTVIAIVAGLSRQYKARSLLLII